MQMWWEQIQVALGSIRKNLGRTMLTMLIIAFGIMALVAMLTSVDGMKSSLSENLAMVGSNSFTISNQNALEELRSKNRKPSKAFRQISYVEARSFQSKLQSGVVSVSSMASGSAKVEYQDKETSPKVTIMGGDQNFIITGGQNVLEGRNLHKSEVEAGRRVALLGYSLAKDIFGEKSGLGRSVKIDGKDYQVVGVLEEKGKIFGQSQDYMAIVPLFAAQTQYLSGETNYSISVRSPNAEQLEQVVGEAIGVMRGVRLLRVKDENDFSILKSDSLTAVLFENLVFLQVVAVIIGMLTLFGAATGLTNIMLVSVTERTREIGLRKAIGADKRRIRMQFLWEAIVICQLGGVIGVLLGTMVGSGVSNYLGGQFIFPWAWVIVGLILCLVTGVAAGYYPANKAARLDPIEALRYE